MSKTKAKEPELVAVLIRFPRDVIDAVDQFAREAAGTTGRPSRPNTIVDLCRRGVVRGDVASAVRRGE